MRASPPPLRLRGESAIINLDNNAPYTLRCPGCSVGSPKVRACALQNIKPNIANSLYAGPGGEVCYDYYTYYTTTYTRVFSFPFNSMLHTTCSAKCAPAGASSRPQLPHPNPLLKTGGAHAYINSVFWRRCGAATKSAYSERERG